MPKFTATIDVMKFDSEGFSKALIAYLQAQMKLAGREFAKTALSRIPVRTGFVAGAFGTLQDLVGSAARLNPVASFFRKTLSKITGRKQTHGLIPRSNQQEFYRVGGSKTLKTTTSGRKFATQASQIFKREGNVLTFNYEVDITYFALNDNVAGHAPTAPWGAFAAAELAFIDFMDNRGLPGRPKMEDFVITSEITI